VALYSRKKTRRDNKVKMENYKLGIKFKDSYNLGEYKQKYLNISTAQTNYNIFMRNVSQGSHIGKYEPLK
jgi:hypothetical protein